MLYLPPSTTGYPLPSPRTLIKPEQGDRRGTPWTLGQASTSPQGNVVLFPCRRERGKEGIHYIYVGFSHPSIKTGPPDCEYLLWTITLSTGTGADPIITFTVEGDTWNNIPLVIVTVISIVIFSLSSSPLCWSVLQLYCNLPQRSLRRSRMLKWQSI